MNFGQFEENEAGMFSAVPTTEKRPSWMHLLCEEGGERDLNRMCAEQQTRGLLTSSKCISLI